MKYRLEIELELLPAGSKGILAETLGITRQAVIDFLKKKTASFNSQIRYTNAFNKAFNKSLKKDFLFELVEEND